MEEAHVQGTAKIYLPKEALISFLSAVYELMPEGKWKSYFYLRGLARICPRSLAELRWTHFT